MRFSAVLVHIPAEMFVFSNSPAAWQPAVAPTQSVGSACSNLQRVAFQKHFEPTAKISVPLAYQPSVSINAFQDLADLLSRSLASAIQPSPFPDGDTSGWQTVVPLPRVPSVSGRVLFGARTNVRKRDVASGDASATRPELVRKRKRSDSFSAIDNLPNIVVVDTNVLITHLQVLVSLSRLQYFTLVVPFTVVQELDHLKTNRDVKLQKKARAAIAYIYAETGRQRTWIQLQRTDEVVVGQHSGASPTCYENNDDRIVNCALFHTQILKRDVLLLTNDKNMALKARGNSLQTTSAPELLRSLHPTAPKRNKRMD